MRHLDAFVVRQLDAAQSAALLLGRDDRVALVASGPDRVKFLHAMLTQSVRDLSAGMVRPALLCDAQGAMQARIELVGRPDDVVLWVDRADAAQALAFLDRFVVMDDVGFALDENLALVDVVGPAASAVAARAGLQLGTAPPELATPELATQHAAGLAWRATTGGRPGAPHGAGLAVVRIQLPRESLGDLAGALLAAGALAGSHAAAEVLRIGAGLPRLGLDVEAGTLPQEAGLGESLHFLKGCYLGQEAVAMLTYRGQLRRHLCWVEVLGGDPQPGWELRTPAGKRAGRMGTAWVQPDGRSLGLATVARKAFEPGLELQARSGDATSDASARVRVVAPTVAGALNAPSAAAPGEVP
ncbi:MAG: hypothetical protein EXR79_12330 [Myxococcales bacterium]|nr:hypothetical protein [Myxococcales bacterium]